MTDSERQEMIKSGCPFAEDALHYDCENCPHSMFDLPGSCPVIDEEQQYDEREFWSPKDWAVFYPEWI